MPNRFSAACITSMDGQRQRELLDEVIAEDKCVPAMNRAHKLTVARQGGPARQNVVLDPKQSSRRLIWRCLICIGLAIAIIGIYAPVGGFQFVDFDDDLYVSQNPHVQAGLTSNSIRWALTNVDLFYWEPLMWISHMLD